MDFHQITEWIIRAGVLLFAITIHEYAHGRTAYALGDPTAKNAGRLSLNPISWRASGLWMARNEEYSVLRSGKARFNARRISSELRLR